MQNVIKNNESIKAKHIATLASGLGLVLTTSAQAAVVYTDVTPDWVRSVSSVDENESSLYEIDFNADSVTDMVLGVTAYNGIYQYVKVGAKLPTQDESLRTSRIVGNLKGSADRLSIGSDIGEGSAFIDSRRTALLGENNSYYGIVGAFTNTGRAFLGVEFHIDGDIKYGWIGLEFSAPTFKGGTLSIFDFAYEDSGASIKAGDKGAPSVAVPEPSSMALLATGALAIAGFRRRKRQQRAS